MNLEFKKYISGDHDQCSRDNGLVYIAVLPGLIKIGASRSVDQRIKSISAMGLGKAECAYITEPHENYFKSERHLHRALSKFKHKGEFYNCSVDDVLNAAKEVSKIDPPKFFPSMTISSLSAIKAVAPFSEYFKGAIYFNCKVFTVWIVEKKNKHLCILAEKTKYVIYECADFQSAFSRAMNKAGIGQ